MKEYLKKSSRSFRPGKGLKNPGKVMSNLGRPLIDWTLEFAASQKLRTIVSTDSNDVRELASSYPFEIDDRPTGLCGDTTEMSEVILHLINKYQLGGSLLVLLQPTSPFENLRISKTQLTSILRVNVV